MATDFSRLLGRMSQEETRDLIVEALTLLTEEQVFDLLENALSVEQKEWLGEKWFNIDKGE